MHRSLSLIATAMVFAVAAPASAEAAVTPQRPSSGADQQLASETVANLLGVPQQSRDNRAAKIAKLLIGQLDADGDGELSSSEISAAIERAGDTSSPDDVNTGISKLDVDGDGKLSASELATGLQQASGQSQGEHRRHRHRHASIGIAH